jgi:uncharacterized protein DUF4254
LAVSIPPGRELAAACGALILEWHRRDPPLEWNAVSAAFPAADESWTSCVVQLCLINCFQWHLEDECRSRYSDSRRLAALKREIDESNRRRVSSIDAIDERLIRELGDPDGSRGTEPVALITPANLLDRISILELKRYHAPSRSDVLALVEEQLDDACRGLDRLVSDLAFARQRVKLYRTVKLYGTTD